MNITEIRFHLKNLFFELYGENPENIIELPLSGSSRRYFRLNANDVNVIGTYNSDRIENEAFIYLADHLSAAGANIPSVLSIDLDRNIYLQEDLGDDSLFQLITHNGLQESEKIRYYKKIIDQMPVLQFKAAEGLNFEKCYPRKAFDQQSIYWDLNYFKNMFLKLSYVPFHEQKLEDDFSNLMSFLLEAPSDFFLFRDFQSRNIMFKEDTPYFIDFQGGRKGALQYDLASLLFDSKAELNVDNREQLLKYYTQVFGEFEFFDKAVFLKYYPAFVLVRLLQAFGAYGYRGLYEKKAIFVHSIIKGLESIQWIRNQEEISSRFPYLCEVIDAMQCLKEKYQTHDNTDGLTVTITSFSYKNGLPEDWTGNGGGYVFDCRALPNPGRLEKYRSSTGRDEDIIEFFSDKSEMDTFIKNTAQLIQNSVETYLDRGFKHLSVGFGCTGGQHRSVYSAEKMFEFLGKIKGVNVKLLHRELNISK